MAKISVVAISDNVCPACYIGLHNLQRALQLYLKTVPKARQDTITTTWHAYQLDPSIPTGESQTVASKMIAKFGPEKGPKMREHLRQIGLKNGILFNPESRIGNTRDSHRVVILARAKGGDVETEVVGEIMRMYFEEGGDITRHEDLVRAAVRGGLDEGETREWLATGKGGDEVDREVAEARKMGVNGVPQFVINGKFVVDGAQEVPEFLEKLALAKRDADGETDIEV